MCETGVLESRENEMVFIETKEIQAMCENIRNQVPAVVNDPEKARLKQQKAGYEILYPPKSQCDENKFICWLFLYNTDQRNTTCL